jgi:threonine/homoserine/homoserine lactone efflux protein
MNLETWIAFVIAATIVLVIPGPTIILVISQAIAHGRRSVLPLVLGVTLGDLTAMTLSLLGMGAILATSAALFSALKWFGTVYLVYLGIKLWRANPDVSANHSDPHQASKGSLFRSTFVVTTLNPKSIMFFVAFLPQFVNPHSQTIPQFMLLGATFLVLGTINAALYGLFAGHLRETLQSSRVCRWINRCGASALIGAGIFAATANRSS